MSAIKLNSSGGGSITISPASTASTLTLTAPAQTGTIGLDGPAFSAWQSVGQALTAGVLAKLQCPNEEFDTANCYDASSSRFTPNVPGYYQISGRFQSTALTQVYLTMYKNGSAFKDFANNSGSQLVASGSALVYCNGTTDYIELYAYVGSTQNTQPNQNVTYFQGVMVRAG